jgi:hypothetical protein
MKCELVNNALLSVLVVETVVLTILVCLVVFVVRKTAAGGVFRK